MSCWPVLAVIGPENVEFGWPLIVAVRDKFGLRFRDSTRIQATEVPAALQSNNADPEDASTDDYVH